MSDSSVPAGDRADQPDHETNDPARVPPAFGLVDIVDAFTAMRHEWRTQSRESRQLSESIKNTAQHLVQIESTLKHKLTAATDDGRLKSLLSIVVELDIALQRAVDNTALQTTVTAPRSKSALRLALINSVQRIYNQNGFFKRWFVRTFFQKVIGEIESIGDTQADNGNQRAAHEGVSMALGRLRRMMAEQNLIRVDTLGKPFDGESMTAIASVDSDQYESGIVAEQLNPAYFYESRLIRYAEVKVSGGKAA